MSYLGKVVSKTKKEKKLKYETIFFMILQKCCHEY